MQVADAKMRICQVGPERRCDFTLSMTLGDRNYTFCEVWAVLEPSYFYSTPVVKRSIVMSVSVCVSVIMSVNKHISKSYISNLHNRLYAYQC